jgi:FkbM family methyltransferase
VTEVKDHISLNAQSLKKWQDEGLERLRYEYDLKPSDTVIDIGAYKGEWAAEIFNRYGCKIIAIEPTEYIRDFKHGQIINKAAGVHNGKMSFGGRAYYTSAFEPGDHEYECVDINPILKQYEQIAMLKINIEGSEYDLLDHIIGAGLHKRVNNLQVQFHQIAGVPYGTWYKDIEKKLSQTHRLTWKYPFCWENWQLINHQ